MQLFAEGKDTNWGHIYYKIEYETTRDKTRLGIRWKITWTIDKYWYFGYNIIAEVWTEGQNFGRQIKANSPNTGSGVSYFPNESEYLWFDEGYASNEINGCRIILKSTNGGTIPFDTGADRTLKTDIGYTFSTLTNNLDFNIGNNISVVISDITNIIYTYKIYLDVYNENNQWQNVKVYETASKNFTLDISDITTTLYNLLPTRNVAPVRLRLETRINDTLLGTFIKEGQCHVINSNPNVAEFIAFNEAYMVVEAFPVGYYQATGRFSADYVQCRVNSTSLSAKNGATISKIDIAWAGEHTIINYDDLPIADEDGWIAIANKTYKNTQALRETLKNYYDHIIFTIIDSRGNKSEAFYDGLHVYPVSLPKITSFSIKRRNMLETDVYLNMTGEFSVPDYGINIKCDTSTKEWLNPENTGIIYSTSFNSSDSHVTIDTVFDELNLDTWTRKFTVTDYPISGDLGASGFTKGQLFYYNLRLDSPNIASAVWETYWNEYTKKGTLEKGKALMGYSENGVAFGADYDDNEGGPLQLLGKNLLNLLHPIGDVIIRENDTDYSNYLGFTWQKIALGKVLVGKDTTQTEFNAIGKTGGEKTHILNIDEIPNHDHRNYYAKWMNMNLSGGGGVWGYSADYSDAPQMLKNTGGGGSHNNLQPYEVVNFWKRIA